MENLLKCLASALQSNSTKTAVSRQCATIKDFYSKFLI